MSVQQIEKAIHETKGVWPKDAVALIVCCKSKEIDDGPWWIFAESLSVSDKSIFGKSLVGNDYRLNLTNWHYLKKEDFDSAIEIIQNKPKFEDHPDAKCFVQDHLGQWFKNILTADAYNDVAFTGWVARNLPLGNSGWRSASKGEIIGNWRDTLTLPSKPETISKADSLVIDGKVTGEVFGFSNSSAHLQLQQAFSKGTLTAEELTAALEPTGKGLHSEVSTTNEADLWYINMELPPVGTECDIIWGDDKLKLCRIEHYTKDKVWVSQRGSDYVLKLNTCKFRPIKTEREKFVEACAKAADGERAMVTVFGKMFDSGEFFYKPKEQL